MEWIKSLDRLPNDHCIVQIRRENGEEILAYFHADKMAWLAFYYRGHQLTHWQCKKTLKWLYDVVAWRVDKDKHGMD